MFGFSATDGMRTAWYILKTHNKTKAEQNDADDSVMNSSKNT